MSEKTFSFDAAANFLGLSASRLDYLVRTKQIPAPRVAIGGRFRYFLESDLAAVKEALEKKDRILA